MSVFRGHEAAVYRGHSARVEDLALTADGSFLITGSQDNSIRIWDAKSGPEARVLADGYTATCLAFSPDGSHLVASHSGLREVTSQIKVWDVAKGTAIQTFGHPRQTTALVVHPRERRFAAAFADGLVKVWDWQSNSEVASFHQHADAAVTGLVSTADGTHLTCDSAKAMAVWDVASAKPVRTRDGCECVALSGDGVWLAAAGADKTVRVWEAATGKQVHSLEGHSKVVKRLLFSGDGRRLVSASAGETLCWKTVTGEREHLLPGAGALVALRHDGQRLVDLKLWDLTLGLETLTWSAGQKTTSLAFSPDGKHLAAGSSVAQGILLFETERPRKKFK